MAKKTGRPSLYTSELIDELCERLSKGEPLAAICREEGMPEDRTIRRWCEERPEVKSAIAQAREAGEEVLLAQCLEISDSPTERTAFGSVDGGHIQEKKLRIETRLKLLAKWNPKKWGEKMDVTSNGNPIPAPQIIAPGVGNQAE